MSDITEKVARAIDPAAWDKWSRERGGIGMAWFETGADREAAFEAADKIIAPSKDAASAAINAIPTTFKGPWVKEVSEDGSMTITDVGDTDLGIRFEISAEDVKRLFGGGK